MLTFDNDLTFLATIQEVFGLCVASHTENDQRVVQKRIMEDCFALDRKWRKLSRPVDMAALGESIVIGLLAVVQGLNRELDIFLGTIYRLQATENLHDRISYAIVTIPFCKSL